MNKNLSANELLAEHESYLKMRFFPTRQQKHVYVNNSNENKVAEMFETNSKYVTAKRVEKLSKLSVAEWISKAERALVKIQVGNVWKTIGKNINGQTWLNPFEVLYLMESNSLLLLYNEVPMSLEQAYSIVFHDFNVRNQYRVYSNLKRNGYVVLNHNHSPSVNKTKVRVAVNVTEPIPQTSFCKKPKLNNYQAMTMLTDASCSSKWKTFKMNTTDNFTNTVSSLICSTDCVDFKTILQKMQIIKSSSEWQWNAPVLKIVFDIFSPSKFKKSSLSKPDYRLLMHTLSHRTELPCSQDVKNMLCNFQDDVPLLHATFSNGSLSYYKFNL